MHEPDILFLDEPTVGLDPQARLDLWEILRDLHNRGRTIVMTTHYMDEADRLCDRLAIIDRGRLLALDTPRALKDKAPGGTLIELVLDGDATPAAEIAETIDGISRVEARDGILRAHSSRGGQILPALIEAAETSGRVVTDIHLLQPSLETRRGARIVDLSGVIAPRHARRPTRAALLSPAHNNAAADVRRRVWLSATENGVHGSRLYHGAAAGRAGDQSHVLQHSIRSPADGAGLWMDEGDRGPTARACSDLASSR